MAQGGGTKPPSSGAAVGAGLAALGAVLVATGMYHDVYNYLSTTTAAILVYMLLPCRLKRVLLAGLAAFTAGSVVFHWYRRAHATHEVTPSNGIVLVTGASSGIGAEMAKEFGRRGFGLVCVARREGKLKELEDEIRRAGLPSGRPIHLVKADLSVPSEAERVYKTVTQDLGIELSILVNNAGIGFTEDFIDTPQDKIEALINLNIVGTTKLTRYFAGDMAERGWGHIATVSSIAGAAPGPHVSVYSATKAYLTSFTLALQHELEPRGVSVTCVVPGATFTEFEKEAHAAGAFAFHFPGVAMAAKDVAYEAVDGILAGRTMIVTGFMNRVYMVATLWVPPKVLRWINQLAWT